MAELIYLLFKSVAVRLYFYNFLMVSKILSSERLFVEFSVDNSYFRGKKSAFNIHLMTTYVKFAFNKITGLVLLEMINKSSLSLLGLTACVGNSIFTSVLTLNDGFIRPKITFTRHFSSALIIYRPITI